MSEARSHDNPHGQFHRVVGSVRRPAQPGELKIKERRSWKTWQLLTAVLIAAVFGMWINGDTGGGARQAPVGRPPGAESCLLRVRRLPVRLPEGARPRRRLPPGAVRSPRRPPRPTARRIHDHHGRGRVHDDDGPVAAAAGPARVLLTSPQLQGNWTSASFTTTAAPWNIGWAFRCAPAPAAGPSFQVFVTPAGSPPAGTPAISETGASGQSVTAQSSPGAQTLVVQAPAGCTWIVKVTGS